MSDVIHLLPDSVANQIAAGEVIQRPASVIKELVENAIDAGASTVTIVLRDGGKNLIQVIDDGCGMSETDARLAFERHATSKITQAADLFDLHTMGFRGEALPSIAAVAQIDLTTMREGDTMGTHLCLAASKFESQEPAACPKGTNLAVKNLFFNFPARRKFLKKDSVELNHIIHEFERLALVNPGKGFHLVHNDVTLHRLLPGSMKQRIVELFGRNLEKQLIPVHTETSLVKIDGFVSLPENARKRNQLQYFFVNGRNMKHPYFQKAVLHCYEELIAPDHQPNFFLSFEVDPSTIDVNIHPTKSEIKFENEAPIWQILVAAIKESLGKFNAVPSIDFDTTATIDIPVFNPSAANTGFNPMDVDPGYNPFSPSAQPVTEESAIFSAGAFAPAQPDSPAAPKSGKLSGIRTDNTLSPEPEEGEASSLTDWERLYAGFRSDVESPFSPASAIDSSYNPFSAGASAGTSVPSFPADSESPATEESQLTLGDADGEKAPAVPGMLQLDDRYILVPSRGGLMVIDRHRAHVKVLFERYMRQSAGEGIQQMMFPETLTLSLSQHVTLESIDADIRALGFDLSYLGDHVWAVNGIPGAIGKLNPVDVLMQIIDNVQQQTVVPGDDLRRRMALSLASASAVRPGQQLSEAEADALLSAFFSLGDPAFTPDGKRTFFILDDAEISRRFS